MPAPLPPSHAFPRPPSATTPSIDHALSAAHTSTGHSLTRPQSKQQSPLPLPAFPPSPKSTKTHAVNIESVHPPDAAFPLFPSPRNALSTGAASSNPRVSSPSLTSLANPFVRFVHHTDPALTNPNFIAFPTAALSAPMSTLGAGQNQLQSYSSNPTLGSNHQSSNLPAFPILNPTFPAFSSTPGSSQGGSSNTTAATTNANTNQPMQGVSSSGVHIGNGNAASNQTNPPASRFPPLTLSSLIADIFANATPAASTNTSSPAVSKAAPSLFSIPSRGRHHSITGVVSSNLLPFGNTSGKFESHLSQDASGQDGSGDIRSMDDAAILVSITKNAHQEQEILPLVESLLRVQQILETRKGHQLHKFIKNLCKENAAIIYIEILEFHKDVIDVVSPIIRIFKYLCHSEYRAMKKLGFAKIICHLMKTQHSNMEFAILLFDILTVLLKHDKGILITVRSEGALKTMIGCIRYSFDNVDYLYTIVKFLGQVITQEANVAAVVKLDVMGLFLKLLRSYPDDITLTDLCLPILLSLSKNEYHALAFEKEKGFQYLVEMMDKYPDETDLMKGFITVLKFVCRKEKILQSFHQSEYITPLVTFIDNFMIKNEQDFEALRICCSTLYCIYRAEPLYIDDSGMRYVFDYDESTVTNEEEDLISMKFPEIDLSCTGDFLLDIPSPNSVRPWAVERLPNFIYLSPMAEEPLFYRERGKLAQSMRSEIERLIKPEKVMSEVVFDSSVWPSEKHSPAECLKEGTPALSFESRFESGNLSKAIRIYETEYDLLLHPDINSKAHTQWFFFSVSNMRKDVAYKLNIINLEKPNSQFNFGMMPVMYSTQDADTNGVGWVRQGFDIGYYPNRYLKDKKGRLLSWYTFSFKIKFPYDGDTVYLAYHYPYTYSDLQKYLNDVEEIPCVYQYYRRQILCRTLGNNICDLLTITNMDGLESDLLSRKVIVITSRVHPGESNSSWVMQGILNFLLSNSEDAKELRQRFVFKIVPMLNPDGVINGNHRCSLSGLDLNRQWSNPSKQFTPTIYYTKLLMKRLRFHQREIMMYLDLHGHSRKKYVFMFGCHNDRNERLRHTEKVFPWMLSQRSSMFSMKDCDFALQESKASTGRIALWREFGITCCYTVESTYCGSNTAHFDTAQLQDFGRHLMENILDYDNLSESETHEIIGEIKQWTTAQKAGYVNPYSSFTSGAPGQNPSYSSPRETAQRPSSASSQQGYGNTGGAQSDEDDGPDDDDDRGMEFRLVDLPMHERERRAKAKRSKKKAKQKSVASKK